MTRVDEVGGKAVLFSDLGLVARETGPCEDAIRCDEQSLVPMRCLGKQGGIAEAWRMRGRTYLIQKRCDEAIACCQTIQAAAELATDERRAGGARYARAQCYEALGRLEEAADLLEQVVDMDRKCRLPKLEEHEIRLAVIRARLAVEIGHQPRPRACLR